MSLPDSPVNRSTRRRLPCWALGALIMLGLALALLAYYQLAPIEAPIPAAAGQAVAGLEQGFTAQGFPRLGRADAPVLVEDFSSYACPHCRSFHDERFPALIGAIAVGQVQFVFVPVPHIGAGAANAARALICAGEQGQTWQMHDTLFYWQKRFLTRTFDLKRIRDGAAALGLDPARFEACLQSEATTARLDTARQEFRARGLSGTPGFFINGVKVQDYREFDALAALVEN